MYLFVPHMPFLVNYSHTDDSLHCFCPQVPEVSSTQESILGVKVSLWFVLRVLVLLFLVFFISSCQCCRKGEVGGRHIRGAMHNWRVLVDNVEVKIYQVNKLNRLNHDRSSVNQIATCLENPNRDNCDRFIWNRVVVFYFHFLKIKTERSIQTVFWMYCIPQILSLNWTVNYPSWRVTKPPNLSRV